ncbi:MAG TPA: GerMN domain-containing protein [Desulfuromonadaceae bacterium]|jgi:spore germination protein GerM
MSSGQRKRLNISLLIPFLVIAVVFGIMIWQKMQASRNVPSAPQVQLPSGKRTVVLFFVADGTRLAREGREVESCDDARGCLKAVLDELFNGPVSDLDEALPEGAVLNSASFDGDTAVVDMNRGFVDDMASGSSAEMLAVYSIVDTICANFPQIARVKLTVEGQDMVVLGHLDLSDPLTPDYTLEQAAKDNRDQTESIPDKKKGLR